MAPRLRVALVTAALMLALPAPATACNSRAHENAKRDVVAGRAPLFIGDSTGIFAVPHLARRGFEADAKGCRQFADALSIASQRRRSRRLPSVLVVALGANGPIQPGQIGRLLEILGPQRELVLVTPRRSPASARRMRLAGKRRPKRVTVLDWVRYSAGKPWFAGDGLHVTHDGARRFAQYLRPALELAVPRRR